MSIVTPDPSGRSRKDQDAGSGAPRTPGQAGRIVRAKPKARTDTTTPDAAPDTSTATQAAATESRAIESAASKTAASQSTATKTHATKATTTKSGATKTAATKTAATKTAATKTAATKTAATKTAATKMGATRTTAASSGAKPSTKTSGKPTTAKSGGGKGPTGKGPGGRGPGGGGPGGRGPGGPRGRGPSGPGRRPHNVVTRKQTPWGLIITAVVVVVLAIGVIGYAISQSGGKKNESASGDGSRPVTASSGSAKNVSPATASVADIEKIQGITHQEFKGQQHENGVIDYGNDSPPFGGPHNQVWAQCTGIVYSRQLASENVVHDLEHGAVWITYRPGLDAASIKTLSDKVLGYNYMVMTPYAGLKTPISLQAWGFQLFVNSADDPRIDQFISDLRLNPKTIPEYGASCDQPAFKAADSYPGHPQDIG